MKFPGGGKAFHQLDKGCFMNIFRIGRSEEDNVTTISTQVDSAINVIVHDIFSCYKLELLSAPSVFIIEAVWGVSRDRELTDTQKAIHTKINMVIHSIPGSLSLDKMTNAQKVVVQYLIRSLITARIMHMIEVLRNKLNEIKEGKDEGKHMLDTLMEINVIGHA